MQNALLGANDNKNDEQAMTTITSPTRRSNRDDIQQI